jgi:hypothetical protein
MELSRREEIIKLLEESDHQALADYSKNDPGLFRTLISLAYDKTTLISWRSIEAVGIFAAEMAKTNPDKLRNLAQRLLWMLREESGNNPWSVPDMLGEMVRNNPDQLADFAPIIASFHEEEILRNGVLRAMVRIGGMRPDLVAGQQMLVRDYLGHTDATARAYAILLAGILKQKDLLDALQPLAEDNTEVKLYEDGEIWTFRISELVRKTLYDEGGRLTDYAN